MSKSSFSAAVPPGPLSAKLGLNGRLDPRHFAILRQDIHQLLAGDAAANSRPGGRDSLRAAPFLQPTSISVETGGKLQSKASPVSHIPQAILRIDSTRR